MDQQFKMGKENVDKRGFKSNEPDERYKGVF
jgi:hypothetical protein